MQGAYDFLTFDPYGLALIVFLLSLCGYFIWLSFQPRGGDGGVEPIPLRPRPTPPARRHPRGGPDRTPRQPGDRERARGRVRS